MSKQNRKTSPLADWIVSLHSAPYTETLTVRATSLRIRDHSYVLEDGGGGLVFAAPVSGVRWVRIKGPEDEEHAGVRKGLAPAGPVAGGLPEQDPRPPLPRRTAAGRTGK